MEAKYSILNANHIDSEVPIIYATTKKYFSWYFLDLSLRHLYLLSHFIFNYHNKLSKSKQTYAENSLSYFEVNL